MDRIAAGYRGHKMKHRGLKILGLSCSLLWFIALLPSNFVEAARLKDIANIGGVRSNQLIGYGLVVGLDGSGDRGRGSGRQGFYRAIGSEHARDAWGNHRRPT